MSLFTLIGCRQPERKMDKKITLTDSWFGSEGNLDGLPTIIRGRDSMFNFFESGLYNHRIEITWTFNEKHETGLPSNAESEEMRKFEDAIVESVESDLQSVLVAVFTWNNTRTWFYYTKSSEEFNTRINKALSEFEEKLPIELSKTVDSNWNEYKEILNGCGLKIK